MGTCWPVPIVTGKGIPSITTFIYQYSYTSTSRVDFAKVGPERRPTLVVWDVQTGVVVKWACTQPHYKVVFHGDQQTITLFGYSHFTSCPMSWHFYTYDALTGTQLCQGNIQLPEDAQLCIDVFSESDTLLFTCWVHKDAIQVTVGFTANEKLVINTYELQPTSINPLYLLSTFCLPHYYTRFSFSPAFSHISFTTATEVIILNLHNSKPLLQTKVDVTGGRPGVFSPNGHFFAHNGRNQKIYVWKNTPTGYVLWSSFRARFFVHNFSWSPTSVRILCWSHLGIHLYHPNHSLNPLPIDKIEPYIMACLTDGIHIATARQQESVVTVLDYRPGKPLQFITTDMQIWDIKAINNTIFVVDIHRLASWRLEADGMTYSACGTRRVAIDEALPSGDTLRYLVLSHDCSQIAFAGKNRIFLYCVETREILKSIDWIWAVLLLQFSPDGYQLWLTKPTLYPDGHYFVKLDIARDWAIVEENDRDSEKWGGWSENQDLDSEGLSANLSSTHGHYLGRGSGWAVDSQGSKLLWLPPSWRADDEWDVRWNGNLLTLLHTNHPHPITIEF